MQHSKEVTYTSGDNEQVPNCVVVGNFLAAEAYEPKYVRANACEKPYAPSFGDGGEYGFHSDENEQTNSAV